MSPDDFIAELWSYANEVPMEQHPWFQGIIQHRWTREQIVLGEVQHYLRVRTNPIFFGYIAVNAVAERQYGLMEVVLENFLEELGGERSHVDIVLQFLEEGGISREEADRAEPAPGTMAAIEMIIGGCQRRSALERWRAIPRRGRRCWGSVWRACCFGPFWSTPFIEDCTHGRDRRECAPFSTALTGCITQPRRRWVRSSSASRRARP